MPVRFEHITSLQNPKIKLTNKLRSKRSRERENLFVIDELRDLQRAMAKGYAIVYLFYCPALGELEAGFFDALQAVTVYEVPPDIMEKVSYRDNPSAIVAVLEQKPALNRDDLDRIDSPHILGLVNLLKPGNIGALMRSADAAGFGTIFLIDTSIDVYNPNIIRSSTGTCFLNNAYTLTSDEALGFFRAHGYAVVSAHPDGVKNLYDARFGAKTALILGTEDEGLSAFWLENCDETVKIPMVGETADSLNVSVSGAVLMYEVLRQSLD
jgi:TrmH family RNA methyltransferase